MIRKKSVLNFLEKNRLAFLSTVDKDGLPHAAPIYYVVEDDFSFSFISPAKTQKCINIASQPEVVLTMTDEDANETIQVRGVAHVDENFPIDVIIDKLAVKLNHDGYYVNNLPLLKHHNQKKVVVHIKTYEVRVRKYHDDRLEEKKFSFS